MVEGWGGERGDGGVGRVGDADQALSPSATEPVPVSALSGDDPSRVKRFAGHFMVFRLRKGRQLAKRVGGKFMPKMEHPSLESAEAAALSLHDQFPDSTFVIMRVVSRVKADIKDS